MLIRWTGGGRARDRPACWERAGYRADRAYEPVLWVSLADQEVILVAIPLIVVLLTTLTGRPAEHRDPEGLEAVRAAPVEVGKVPGCLVLDANVLQRHKDHRILRTFAGDRPLGLPHRLHRTLRCGTHPPSFRHRGLGGDGHLRVARIPVISQVCATSWHRRRAGAGSVAHSPTALGRRIAAGRLLPEDCLPGGGLIAGAPQTRPPTAVASSQAAGA
jgi:hypothetical protein